MSFVQFLIDIINNFNSVSYGLGGTSIGIMFAILTYYIAKTIKAILDYYYNKLVLPLLKKMVFYIPKKITGKAIDMMDGKTINTIDGRSFTIIANETTNITEDEKHSKTTQSTSEAELERGQEAYENGDYDKAIKIVTPLAEKGNAKAQFNLGLIYQKKGNKTKIIKWWKLAAEQGIARAQYNLGAIYYNGEGIPKSKIYAYIWLSFADANGYEDLKEMLEEIEEELTPDNRQKAGEKTAEMTDSNPNLIRPQSDFDL